VEGFDELKVSRFDLEDSDDFLQKTSFVASRRPLLASSRTPPWLLSAWGCLDRRLSRQKSATLMRQSLNQGEGDFFT
jgi:hypothetical protein